MKWKKIVTYFLCTYIILLSRKLPANIRTRWCGVSVFSSEKVWLLCRTVKSAPQIIIALLSHYLCTTVLLGLVRWDEDTSKEHNFYSIAAFCFFFGCSKRSTGPISWTISHLERIMWFFFKLNYSQNKNWLIKKSGLCY